MSERLTLRLIEPTQAHKAIATAWSHCKAHLMAGRRMVLEVRPETRSEDQNALLHADLCEYLFAWGAEHGVVWSAPARRPE